jgi:hypothetical protein
MILLTLFALLCAVGATSQARQAGDTKTVEAKDAQAAAAAKTKERADQVANQAAKVAQIRLVPDAPQVVLSGRPASDLSLTKRITLMADQQVSQLLFHPGDLHLDKGNEVISASQVQLLSAATALQKLQPNTPQDIDFKVSGLKVPGSYSGVIEFLQAEHGPTPALRFGLKLNVEETPKLSQRNGSTNLKVQLVNCFPIIGCPLRHWLYGQTEDHSFTLDNTSTAPFKLTGAVAASGDTTHASASGALALNLPEAIPALPIVTIPLTVKGDVLSPDHYAGDIQLRIPGKEDPLKIPMDLNVKSGPEIPILVLLIGILLGRFIKYMKDKGAPQSELLLQLFQVQARAAQDPQNLGLLQHMLEELRNDIDGMQLDSAKSDLALINSRLTLLSRLRYLETLLTPRAGDAAVAAILSNIRLARDQISLGNDPQTIASQIDTQVKSLQAPGSNADTSLHAIELAAATSVRGAAQFAAAPVEAPASKLVGLRRAVRVLTGHSDTLRADFTLWFLRPLAWALLIVLLVVTGFVQLYTKNATFGADLVSDYFGLLVWATGSDVASRTLSNFKGS